MYFNRNNKFTYKINGVGPTHVGIPTDFDFEVELAKDGTYILTGYKQIGVNEDKVDRFKGKLHLTDLSTHQKSRFAYLMKRQVFFICKQSEYTTAEEAFRRNIVYPLIDFSADGEVSFIKLIMEKLLEALGLPCDYFKVIVTDKEFAVRWESKVRSSCRI